MISDKNKNITSIEYNQLNLPKKMVFGTGDTIEYIYSAVGQKLEKIVKEGTTTSTTNYLGGFQYKDDVLEFFPTPEGYVKNDNGALSYVFQYKDHLGNIRVSYAQNPTTQVLEIIDENNYYPFGLKHKGYNDYVGTNNKYKYQGQERQDELGLNWDSFKWRNYDPAMARFMSIDPLTEDYNDWSPYVFSGNRVVDARELEGLEPYVLFNTEEEAALNWGQQYNGKSIRDSKEYGSSIGRKKVKGKYKYLYGPPKVSESSSSVHPSPAPKGTIRTADIHSHGSYDPKILSWNDRFSDTDKASNRKLGINGYLTTPSGTLQLFFPNGDGEFIINRGLEYDRNDPSSPPSVLPVPPLTPMPIVPIPNPLPSVNPLPNINPLPNENPLPVHFPNINPRL